MRYRSCIPLFLVYFATLTPLVAEETSVVELIRASCLACHSGDEDAESDVDLSKVSRETLSGDAALTRKLVDVLDKREMPPEDAPQPTDEQRSAALKDLKALLSSAQAHAKHSRAPIRRMNRFQYNNAVVDLFDLKLSLIHI